MARRKAPTLHFELSADDLQLFVEEANEQMELLDGALVHLETNADPELVQQIFRAAHTLKGSAATIGHQKMASLTHAMETVLDAIRQGRKQPTREMVDALLTGLDVLRMLLQEVVTRVDSGTETSGLEAALLRTVEGGDEPQGAATAAESADSHVLEGEDLDRARIEVGQGRSAYLASITVDAECQLPSIRCFQALQEMDALGTVHRAWPDRAAVEAGEAEYSLAAIVTADVGEEQLSGALNALPDLSAVEVQRLDLEDLGETADTPAGRLGGASRPALSVVGPGDELPAAPRKASQSVRIDVERLDGLMNLVGELVIDRTRLKRVGEQLAEAMTGKAHAELTENFEQTTAHLARVIDELQNEIMRSRMLPVRTVFSRLPRLVRDVAARSGKEVELVTSGEETEIDRSVIEEVADPLVHILRNAVDHGIETPEERRAAGKPETGTILVNAWNQESSIYISVRDDGRGIDTGKLREKAAERGLVAREVAEAASEEAAMQYIFLPGLSTAKEVSDVSGRGVGMDIVRNNIERLNGHVRVESTPGVGTEFVIQLPLTLATRKALLVGAGGNVYALPLLSVTEAVAWQDADLQTAGGATFLRLRDELLPLRELTEALGGHQWPGREDGRFIVIVRQGKHRGAFAVDRVFGEQDVVVKPIGDIVGQRRGLAGATILGDGTLGLIVDVASLMEDEASLAATG